MIRVLVGTRSGRRSLLRGSITLLLLAAMSLGILPFSIEQPPLADAQKIACRFEPIDVCGARDTSLGVLADTPVLLAAAVTVGAEPGVLPTLPEAPSVLLEGFAPGVYRPPRPSC